MLVVSRTRRHTHTHSLLAKVFLLRVGGDEGEKK